MPLNLNGKFVVSVLELLWPNVFNFSCNVLNHNTQPVTG